MRTNENLLNGRLSALASAVRDIPARRRLSPAWVKSEAETLLVSLPPTLHGVRDELVSGLREQVTFYRTLVIGLLVILAVVMFLS